MTSKQTRKSISISKEMYDRLKIWCEINDRSMSSVVEETVGRHLNLVRKQQIAKEAAQKHHEKPIERNGNVFTF